MCSALSVPEVAHTLLEGIGVNIGHSCFPVVEVINKVLDGNATIAALESKAFTESLCLLSNSLLAGGNGRVSLPVALLEQVVKLDNTISIGNAGGECMNKGKLVCTHFTADGCDKLVVADDAITVLVEVFEDALEFGNIQFHAKLAKHPLDFVAIKNTIAVLIHLNEKL